MENDGISKTMALGRPFQLGMLYNLTTDTLISNTSLWNSNLIENSINYRFSPSNICEVHTENTITKKADLLGMDTYLKISVLTNPIELSGSAKLIHTRKTTQHKRSFIVKYSLTTYIHELKLTNLHENNIEIFDENLATHVVIGILYGIEIYFIFDRVLYENENHTNIDTDVIKLLEKMIKLEIFNNDQLNLNEHEEQIAQLLACNYYGDFTFNFEPRTFKQVAKLFQNLSEYRGTVPKQVWLYPLYLLNNLNLINEKLYIIHDDLVLKSFKLIERLHELEMIVNDLRYSLLSITILHQIKHQLLTIFIRIQQFEITIKKKMRNIILDIRLGIQQEIILANLLNDIELFFLNEENLKNWIELITRSNQTFIRFFEKFNQQRNINMSDTSPIENSNNEVILCLIIHLIEKNDPFLNEMFEYLNNSDNIDRQYNQNINKKYWFNQDNFVFIQNKIGLFCEFAEVNEIKQNIKFIVQQQYADDFLMKKDVSIILYQNSTTENFEIPSRPGQPYVTNINTDQNITLNWSIPIYGSRSIQKYKIYQQINTTNQWTLVLTTTHAIQSVVISNLVPGKYQFKVQGITLIGDTAMSDISDIIG